MWVQMSRGICGKNKAYKRERGALRYMTLNGQVQEPYLSSIWSVFCQSIYKLIMQQHQHGPGCRHGHGEHSQGHAGHAGHGHTHGGHTGHAQSHGHGHGHGPMGGGVSAQIQNMPPEQYFKELSKKYKEKPVFFWQQVLFGVALEKTYQKYGLNSLRSLNCNMLTMIVASLQNTVSMECTPTLLKHVLSGLFFPLLFLLFFNYNAAVGVGHENETLKSLVWTTLALYLLVGFRGSGELNNQQVRKKTKEIFTIRPYLQNPNSICGGCGIIRFYRSMHCPFCKSCISKHSRHSVLFGICIGAANQLIALLFFFSLFATQAVTLYLFSHLTYGIITKVLFYLMNGVFCWMSFTEFAKLTILNLYYGITEGELKTWTIQQYLLKVPERVFENNVDQGPLQNTINSISAVLGIGGFQSENYDLPQPLAFPQIDPSKTYRINWAKAYIYMAPLLPCHKNRQQVTDLMLRQQGRMVQMFKLQKQMKEQVIRQANGEQLNEFQLQQRMAIKMQAYMVRNMPQMMQPSPEQQKVIQIQMLNHMRNQFASEPDLAPQIDLLKAQLQEGKLTPIQANMRMRQLQQELMQRRMSKVMKQHQEQMMKAEQDKKKHDEDEEAPIADEDL